MVIRSDDFLGLMSSTHGVNCNRPTVVHKPNWFHSNHSQVLQEATKQLSPRSSSGVELGLPNACVVVVLAVTCIF